MDSGRLSSELGEDNVVTCATSGRGSIVLGDLKVNKTRRLDWIVIVVIVAGPSLAVDQQAAGGEKFPRLGREG